MQEILSQLFSGVIGMFSLAGVKSLIMFAIAGVLIYLAVKKDYEPTLLLPIGFGCILANLPPLIGQVMENGVLTEGPVASVLESGKGFLDVLFMPYQMVKDTRTGFETSNIDGVMDGDLDGFLNAYLTQLATGELKK